MGLSNDKYIIKFLMDILGENRSFFDMLDFKKNNFNEIRLYVYQNLIILLPLDSA